MSFYESRESLLFARSFQKIHSPRNGMGARLKTRDKITRSRLVSFGHSGNWRVREPIERGLQEKRSVRIVTVNRPRFNYIVFSLSLSQPNFVHPWKRGARARAPTYRISSNVVNVSARGQQVAPRVDPETKIGFPHACGNIVFLSSRGWRFVPETEANRASTRDILSSSNIYEKKNIRNKLIISRIIPNLSRDKIEG